MVTGLVVSAVTVCYVFWSVLPPLVIGPVLPVRRVIRVVLARCATSVVISIMGLCRIVGVVPLGRVSSVMISFVLVGPVIGFVLPRRVSSVMISIVLRCRAIGVVLACPVVSVMLPGRLLNVMPPRLVLRGLLLEGHRAGGRRRNTEGQDDWIHLRFL